MRREFDSPYPHQKILLQYIVYILKSTPDQELYIESTNNLKKRLKGHSSAKVQSTKHRPSFFLKYYEIYTVEYDAREHKSKLEKRGNTRSWPLKHISYSLES
ncbi:MAG: GIY-YIG nuclease family protein [Patescibacteria group bacterium]